ncbi:peptidase [Paenibacillus sp. 79R4]|uniref:DUF1796 family putative cysteine peptidase n=1 Tax=Paenibacillus sp. 79R4 TaxID=2212847 RepID=UPI0015BE83ED|nr:DUF1796 family putative cysteine peptidase [Paenibacillus sp. 79R4]NWL88844.1 peptidase [Paenibacillus sp. 79R4]
MLLHEIKGQYQAVFSLGDNCLPAIQLERNGLRPYSGPLDWLAIPQISDLNRLLLNRFAGFMDLSHLKVVSKVSDRLFLVEESFYQLYLNHDFFTHNNTETQLFAYSEVKAKYDRRVNRFLEKIATSQRILFVHSGGTLQQIPTLTSVLSRIVAGDFRLLHVNHAPVQGIIDHHCPQSKVCSLSLPDREIWNGNNSLWAQILSGITLES